MKHTEPKPNPARKAVFGIALAATLIGTLAACNTVKGLGEDIQSVGRAGEDAID